MRDFGSGLNSSAGLIVLTDTSESAPGSGTWSIEFAAMPTPIPTLSEWGLGLMFILIAGSFLLRKQRRA